MAMFIIGYEYESSMGYTLRKAVICDTYDEYLRVKEKVNKTAGYKLIEFDHVFESNQIPR